MKKLSIITSLLFTALSFSQVGIGTTFPTKTIDVNGGARIRSLSSGTIQSDIQGNLEFSPYKVYAFAVIEKSGAILKQFGVSNVQHLGNGKYRITFTTPMTDNDYIILSMGKNKTLTYDAVTTDYVEVEVNSLSGQYDFNVMIIDLI